MLRAKRSKREACTIVFSEGNQHKRDTVESSRVDGRIEAHWQKKVGVYYNRDF